MTRAHFVGVLGLSVLLVVSGIGVSYAKYQSRQLFVEVQRVRALHEEAEMEWGRLQLELATSAALGRVTEIATGRLQMHVPSPAQIVVVD